MARVTGVLLILAALFFTASIPSNGHRQDAVAVHSSNIETVHFFREAEGLFFARIDKFLPIVVILF
jgi:hypothetical protein